MFGQVTEVANSNQMEMEGLVRSMAFLENEGVSVATLVTDRHGQVRKWLRENKPRIEHLFDVWHIAKGKLASEWVSQPVSVSEWISEFECTSECERKCCTLSFFMLNRTQEEVAGIGKRQRVPWTGAMDTKHHQPSLLVCQLYTIRTTGPGRGEVGVAEQSSCEHPRPQQSALPFVFAWSSRRTGSQETVVTC